MTKHLVIPDTQVKPGHSTAHLKWAGEYAAEKKPDVIIHIGDHWDMASLSSYDVGKKSFEGRRYINDINAGINAMRVFLEPIQREQDRLKRNKWKQWNPRLVFTLGNHEHRIERAIESDPKLDGLMKYEDSMLEEGAAIRSNMSLDINMPFISLLLVPLVPRVFARQQTFRTQSGRRNVHRMKVLRSKKHARIRTKSRRT